MRPKSPSILLSLSILTISCTPKETTVKGIVIDASMNTITVSSQGDTLRFSTLNAEKKTPNGIRLQDSATVFYKGSYSEGMPAGICSMDRTLSQPSMELEDLMGTPMTGRGVMAAITPGR